MAHYFIKILKHLEIFCDNKNKEIYLVAVSNIFIVSILALIYIIIIYIINLNQIILIK